MTRSLTDLDGIYTKSIQMLYSRPMIAARAHCAADNRRRADGPSRRGRRPRLRGRLRPLSPPGVLAGPAHHGLTGGAEEATQDAFLSLWRGASSFDPERGSLATWLLTLVRYRSIDWLRRGTHRALHQELTQDAVERIEAPERTDEQVLAIQEHDRARRLVAELPPEQREVIDLAYFAGYTQTEIAARVGIPLGTVKSRARLGLLKLRQAAEREAAPLPAA